jgi:arylsulfatase A-like enzyme/Flp pilus assembly protein TadD
VKRVLFIPVVLVLAAAAAVVVLWMGRLPGAGLRTAQPASRLNVLLITIDTLRADRLGNGFTPALDALARRGASFSNVRATVPLTLPSHVSLMTGTIPPVHGVRENGQVFDRQTPTLAAIFKGAGYRTGAFVGAFVLNRRFGLDDGFETYDDTVRRDMRRAERLEAERPGAEVVDAALKWLPSDAGAPFFGWVHLYDPHAPYAPPQEFLDLAKGHAYDGEVAYADAQVGRLLDGLERRGLSGSTIVAVTSDHGEGLGEHGEQTHGMLVYDSTLRVPLVVSAPGFVRSSNQPCHWDVAPALLRLAGLAERVPGSMTSAVLLRKPGGGEPVADAHHECLSYSESRYPRRAGWHALTASADLRWKLIASSERELYDLQEDPAETRNVAAEHPTIVQAMAATLAQMQPRTAGAPVVAADAAERLRALGYASGSNAITSDDPQAPNPASAIGAWTTFEQALGQLHAGGARAAASVLHRLVAAYPGAPVFHSTYAQALRASGDVRGAVQAYRKAVAKWPSDAALFHDLAVAAREAGDVAEATRAAQAALTLDGTSAMAQNGLGLLHADAGRRLEAAAAFDQATRQDPTNPSYWTNLGHARGALGDGSAAEQAYGKALALDSGFADALNGLGTLFVQRERAAEAVPLFESALRRDPELHEARLNLGIAYQQSGQLERAAETYRDVLKKTPPRFARERAAAADLLRSLKERPVSSFQLPAGSWKPVAGRGQNVNRNPICPTRCSGFWKSPEYSLGCRKSGFGVPSPSRRPVRNPAGFLAFSRLKTSAIASIFVLPTSRNARETRRFSWVRHAPRPQFQVSHDPISLGALPTPSN